MRTASSGPETIIIAVMDDYDPSLVQPPTEVKPPPELTRAVQNVVPDVVTDTAEVTSFIPITEEIITTVTDGDVNDILVGTFHGTSLLQHICQFFYLIKQCLETISG